MSLSDITEDTAVAEEQTDDFDLEVPVEGPSGTSLRTRLRNRRAKLQEERELFLPIPGYSEELWARFHPVPWERIEKISTDTEKSKSRSKILYAMVDTLVAACGEVLVCEGGECRTKDDLKRIQDIEPEFSGDDNPIRFGDKRLAEYLGFEVKDGARSILRDLIPEEMALTGLHNDVMEWQKEVDQEVDDDLAGE